MPARLRYSVSHFAVASRETLLLAEDCCEDWRVMVVPSVLWQRDSTIMLLPSRKQDINAQLQMAEILLKGLGSMSQMDVDCEE